MSSRLIVSAFIVLLETALVGGQTSTSISGSVLLDGQPRLPVRRAVVTATRVGHPTITAITDDQGRFVLNRLVPGEYVIGATKNGLVSLDSSGHQRVVVSGDFNRSDLVVLLQRGAVVSGTVLNPSGEPAANLSVTVFRVDQKSAVDARSPAAFQCRSDDRGRFRAYGLDPGDYVIAASPEGQGITGVMQPSAAELDAVFRSLQSRANSPQAAVLPHALARNHAYATFYFPGTPLATSAERVRLSVAEERSGLDFVVGLVEVGRIEGTVVFDGQPPQSVRVAIASADPVLPYQSPPKLASIVDRLGGFQYADVSPGRYVLLATAPGGASSTGKTTVSTGGIRDILATDRLFALTELNILPGETVPVTLALRLPSTLSGQVLLEPNAGTGRVDITRIRISLVATKPPVAVLSGRVAAQVAQPVPGDVQPDGTFKITRILPGAYTLTALMPSDSPYAELHVTAATIENRNALTAPIVFAEGQTDVTGAFVRIGGGG